MKKISLFLLPLAFVFSPELISATQNNLEIKQLTRAEDGLYVRFTSRPSACSTTYKGFHGVISNTYENFDSFYLELVRTKALRKKVNVTYTDRGNCDVAKTLLLISSIQRSGQ